MDFGVTVGGVFIFVDGHLEQVACLLGMGGERNGAEELLGDARNARSAGSVVGSCGDARRRSLRPGSQSSERRKKQKKETRRKSIHREIHSVSEKKENEPR